MFNKEIFLCCECQSKNGFGTIYDCKKMYDIEDAQITKNNLIEKYNNNLLVQRNFWIKFNMIETRNPFIKFFMNKKSPLFLEKVLN
jgi:hypothetical protein